MMDVQDLLQRFTKKKRFLMRENVALISPKVDHFLFFSGICWMAAALGCVLWGLLREPGFSQTGITARGAACVQ